MECIGNIGLGHQQQQQPEHEDEKHILKCAVNKNLIKLINTCSFIEWMASFNFSALNFHRVSFYFHILNHIQRGQKRINNKLTLYNTLNKI